MKKSFLDYDPLTAALAPPSGETPQEAYARERAEARAKSISDEIDQQLKTEAIALKKKKPVKVLLLGQSESGGYFRLYPSCTCIHRWYVYVGKSATLKSSISPLFQ
jgi:hypothetical protein